ARLNCAAWCPERSRPLSAMISSARWSAPPPTCQSPVPADSITTFSRPARSKASRSITSPIGERQIFPVHTTLIVYGEAIPYSQHISARCAPPRVPGVTPRRLFPHRFARPHHRLGLRAAGNGVPTVAARDLTGGPEEDVKPGAKERWPSGIGSNRGGGVRRGE